jgi:hypothetical protein
MAHDSPFIDILRTVFPVVATVPGGEGELARPDFFGTAFAVADGVFMTADHVARAAAGHGQLTLGRSSEKPMLVGARVQEWESWPERDVALLFGPTNELTLLNTWLISRVQVLTDLSSFGFPHAITRENGREHFDVVFRAYKGHVITTRGFDRLPNRPTVYEMSYPYPEGLSGGPVLLNHEGQLAVAGIVIGSQSVSYGGVDHTVGIALIADEIASLRSERLGGTLGDVLRFNAAELRHGEQL